MHSTPAISHQKIWNIFSLNLSDKLKFSIKASLSLAFVVLISFSLGWSQASTAMITIIIIASVGSVGDSVNKGLLRVIGTLVGATIGIALIAIFPQDRMLYLVTLSILVTITLYLTRAYRGDNSAFMLTAVTMMMVFQNGAVEDSFTYSIDRTFMTLFAIALYALVGTLLWPVDLKDNSIEDALALLETQQKLYIQRGDNKLWQDMLSKEQTMSDALCSRGSSSIAQEFSSEGWQKIVTTIHTIGEQLFLLSSYKHDDGIEGILIKNYERVDNEIKQLFTAITEAIKEQKEISNIPESWSVEYDRVALKKYSHLQRASLIAMSGELSILHRELRELALYLNRQLDPIPRFESESIATTSSFIWWDSDHLKGTLISFIIFWVSTYLWIEFNPPGGFLIVTLATALSILTTFTPVKPSSLIVIFSFSFLFAAFAYIVILPHLIYGWELGLFIFLYSFIGYYFIPPKLSLFFLMGLMTLGLSNEMSYNFDLFLLMLFTFYAFLSLLLLFYYIPFSTKAQDMFILNKNRFFGLAKNLTSPPNTKSKIERMSGELKAKYSQNHLIPTLKKMQLWANQIDTKAYETIESGRLSRFLLESERLAHLLLVTERQNRHMSANRLYTLFSQERRREKLAEALATHSTTPSKPYDIESQEELMKQSQELLDSFFDTIDYSDYSHEEIALFYESLNLRKNLWITLLEFERLMDEIDFEGLMVSRF